MQEISLTEIVEHANVLIAEFKASRHNRNKKSEGITERAEIHAIIIKTIKSRLTHLNMITIK